MVSPHRLAEVASLIGDSSRAAMLTALLDGSARPAGELATWARVSPATASGHLARLVRCGLLRVEPLGRHRYYRIADPWVAEALEALGRVLPVHDTQTTDPERLALREARMCYDHIAGRLGVAIAGALVAKRWLSPANEGFLPTPAAERGFRRLGIALDELRSARRPLVRVCLDWTERREHVAGALGALITSHALESGWIARRRGVRALRVTQDGVEALRSHLGLRLDPV
jgi:DNA-binding transcriptional ArsR family regulator